MKNKLINLIKQPNKTALAIIYPVTALLITASIVLMLKSFGGAMEIITYVLYGLTAIAFGYSIYTIVILAHKIKSKIINILKSNSVTSELLGSFGYRTIMGLAFSLTVSIVYGLYNGVIGIVNGSVWFGSLAAYYLLLTLIRSAVLFNRSKSKGEGGDLRSAKTYLASGVGILLLNIALSVSIFQMIFDEKGFEYGEYMIYVSALYAFIKIGMSIYNFIKAQKQKDLIIESARNINLIDSAVSILALQTAMLYTFSGGAMDVSLANTLTGSAVTVCTYSVAIYMIIKGIKTINKIKSENNNG